MAAFPLGPSKLSLAGCDPKLTGERRCSYQWLLRDPHDAEIKAGEVGTCERTFLLTPFSVG